MEAWMKPMLCKSAPTVAGYDPADWAAEAKIDGWRAICHVNGAGVRVFGGRNGSDYSGQVPYLEAALAAALPPDSCVDGELMSASGWGGVQGAMTRAGCGDNTVRLVIFDVLRLAGHDTRGLPWTDRHKLVTQLPVSLPLSISPAFDPAPNALQAVLNTGFEGLVLKRRASRYTNSRSADWVKIKPQSTCEARVTGFKPGEGSFAGLVGALEFELLDENGKPTGARSRCSGFDMTVRAEITANPGRWLGQVIEIKHHGIGKEGKPRHPQFLRRRDDQTPRPTPAKPPTIRRTVSTVRMRNYGAMYDAKLVRCIEELECKRGDAYDRCVSKGGNPDEDLAVARAVARERGL